MPYIGLMQETHAPVGWFVHVRTTDLEDTPTVVRHFYVAEPDRSRAEQIAAGLGETAMAPKTVLTAIPTAWAAA